MSVKKEEIPEIMFEAFMDNDFKDGIPKVEIPETSSDSEELSSLNNDEILNIESDDGSEYPPPTPRPFSPTSKEFTDYMNRYLQNPPTLSIEKRAYDRMVVFNHGFRRESAPSPKYPYCPLTGKKRAVRYIDSTIPEVQRIDKMYEDYPTGLAITRHGLLFNSNFRYLLTNRSDEYVNDVSNGIFDRQYLIINKILHLNDVMTHEVETYILKHARKIAIACNYKRSIQMLTNHRTLPNTCAETLLRTYTSLRNISYAGNALTSFQIHDEDGPNIKTLYNKHLNYIQVLRNLLMGDDEDKLYNVKPDDLRRQYKYEREKIQKYVKPALKEISEYYSGEISDEKLEYINLMNFPAPYFYNQTSHDYRREMYDANKLTPPTQDLEDHI